MPVDVGKRSAQVLYQRQQYAKGGVGRWYWDVRDRTALSCIEPGDRRILDLGCGEGITLQRLLAAFPDRSILGIDLDPENIAICHTHHLPARLGDLYHLDLPEESYDVVFFLEVIEHLEHPEKAVREIHRVLRPGGKIVIIIPNDFNFLLARLLTLKFNEAFYDPGHLHQWTPAEMVQFLGKMGFTILGKRNMPLGLWVLSLHGLIVARK